jgi:hypothetical protein
MRNNKRPQDTLSIDMKYIILYRKLGFREIKPDIFIYHYANTSITIDAENQWFKFQEKRYSLSTYKDMVLLECIDRLLKIGYKSSYLRIDQRFDIEIMTPDKKSFCGIYIVPWGEDFRGPLKYHIGENPDIVVFYTSQLSGGLIDFVSEIHMDNNLFEIGLFENQSTIYPTNFSHKEKKAVIYDTNQFVVIKNELKKYIGKEESVIIPKGIVRIGIGAFWNNLIVRTIEIPNTVICIAGDAFSYCENLEKVNIPVSVNEIGDNPFAGCPKLKITCLSNNFILEKGVLFSKDKSMLIHYTVSKPDEKYLVPESVEWIGKHSFYKSLNLLKVVVSRNVSFMANNVFSDCMNVGLKNESPYFKYINGVLYNNELTQVFHYSIGSHLKEVSILEGVRVIGRNSFWNAKEIEKIIIPSTTRQIGYNPFAYCINTEFENYSPYYTLRDGVLYSSGLQELICCTSRVAEKEFDLPKDLLSVGRNAFTGCESLSHIELPESIESIARGAFSGCINLEEIIIPNNVKWIGDWCFNNCVKLRMIKIHSSVKIGENFADNCPAKIISC